MKINEDVDLIIDHMLRNQFDISNYLHINAFYLIE